MADISQELEQIRNARYGDDIRTAIANALEAINKNTSCTDELASLKETLNRLSEAIDKGAAENASEEEVQVLKAYVDNISDTLNEGESGYIPTRSLELKALTRDGNGEDSFTSSDYVTRNELNVIRGQINSELNLKATQYDFDYIVGNGFQDWTITDYIIRIREDFNAALSDMASRSYVEDIADAVKNADKKLVVVNEAKSTNTKVSFTTTSTEITLAEYSDVERVEQYFTFDWSGSWERGGLDANGAPETSTSLLRTIEFLPARDFKAVLDSAYSLQVVRYDVNKLIIRKDAWRTGSARIQVGAKDAPGTTWYKFLIKKNDGTNITNVNLPATILQVTMSGTDWTGTHSNVAMDPMVFEDIVIVSETQPTSPVNEIWVDPRDNDEVALPTYEEFEALRDDTDNYVRFDEVQTKTETEKATARENIGAPATNEVSDLKGALSVLENGLDNKNVSCTLEWKNEKRLDATGAVVNATSAFYISQVIQISDDPFYLMKISGINNVTAMNGSCYAIRDSSNNVLKRDAIDGTFVLNRSNFPSGSASIQFSHQVETGYPLDGVLITKTYAKRISELESDMTVAENVLEDFTDTLDESYNNVLSSASSFTDKKFVNEVGNEVANPNFCLIDGYFPVKPNTSYKLYRGEPALYSNAGHNWTFYDENKQFITGSYILTANAVTSPSTSAYMRLAIYISNTGSATHENFDPTKAIVTKEAKPCFGNVFTSLVSRPVFAGKKWIGIGDSITEENFRAVWHYYDYIKAETGMTFDNMGVSGSGYQSEGGANAAFWRRVPNMATDADLITIFGGVNDVIFSHTIGTASDNNTETVCGCVNKTIDEIEELYPAHMPIGVISPLPCYCIDTSIAYPDQEPSNDQSRMAQFVEQLSIICKRRGIPFLDLFHSSNLRPWNSACNSKYFSCDSAPNGDGLHPNGHGHRLFYRQILEFIKGIVDSNY